MPRKTGISKFPTIVVPSVRQLPRTADYGQPAFVMSNRRIYHFINDSWEPFNIGSSNNGNYSPLDHQHPAPGFLWTNKNAEPGSWIYSPNPTSSNGVWAQQDEGLSWNASSSLNLYLHDISVLATSWHWQVYKNNALAFESHAQHYMYEWPGGGEEGTYKIRLTINDNPLLVRQTQDWTIVAPP